VIASALSSDASADPALVVPDGVHWINLGTSMAAPHVTGIYAQILGLNPNLDAIQLRTLLTETARSDIYTGAVPNNNWGYGKPDALAAMQDPRARVVIDLMMSGAGGSWMGLGTADSYNVYKADIGALDGVFFGNCFLAGNPSPSFNDPAIPAVGSGFAYTVTGVLGGVEGPVRHDWTTGTSVLIPPGDTCP
jgi:hypothetical protein